MIDNTSYGLGVRIQTKRRVERMFCVGFLVLFAGGAFATTTNSCHECLALTPYIDSGRFEQARQLSRVHPSHFLGISSHSGYITVNKEYDSNLFFWFFPHPETSRLKETPWVLWLNGGPGVSSLTGLFKSIGPIQIVNGKLERRPVTWASNYSLLFVDSPVGAGFSYTRNKKGYPDSEDKVSADLYEFLRQFAKLFPQLVSAPLFFAGSSYSGKYVPAIAYRVHTHKKEVSFNFRGIIMGNALIDPRHMMHYSELVDSLGFMDRPQLQQLRKLEQKVVELIDDGLIYNASNKFNETVEYIKKISHVSVYNFEKDPSNAAPEYEAFVNKPSVRGWIHAGNATFDFNNQLVYNIMLSDIMNTSKPVLEELLEHYGVLSYRYRKGGGNLIEVLVRRAGHDAAGDQPEVVKFIVDDFIKAYK